MTTDQTQKLLQLYDAGYKIEISRGYVDNNFRIYEADADTLEQNNGFHESLKDGDICFDSEVYSQYPLKEISINEVTVFKPISDWQEEARLNIL